MARSSAAYTVDVLNIYLTSSDRGLEFDVENVQTVPGDESGVHQSVSIVLCFVTVARKYLSSLKMIILSLVTVFPLGWLADPV